MTKNKSPHTNTDDWQTESWPIDAISAYQKNAKLHDESQITRLAAAIKEFGFRQPIVVDEKGVVLAGHGRRLAAMQLGLTHVPVNVARGLTEKQKKAYRISDNKVTSNAYDEALLGREIMELAQAAEFDMSLLSMTDLELGDIYKKFSLDGLNNDDFLLASLDDLDDTTVDRATGDSAADGAVDQRKGVEYEKSYSVIVDCADEDEQRELYEQLHAEGRNCKIMTM